MKALLCIVALAAGCATFGQQPYKGKRTTPHVEEYYFGHAFGNSMGLTRRINKIVDMHNPVAAPMRFHVSCKSIYQPDIDVVVPAKTSQFALIDAYDYDAYTQTCAYSWEPVL